MSTITLPNSILPQMRTSQGQSLAALSEQQTIILVFLRHFGCTFCRQALSDLSHERQRLAILNTELVLVHMSDNETAEEYFHKYKLTGVKYICDPTCRYYQGFGLVKGTFNQLFGLQSWIKGFQAGVVDGHGIGAQLGDGFQMPGVFVIKNGQVRESYIHKLASDRPDYLHLVQTCCQPQHER